MLSVVLLGGGPAAGEIVAPSPPAGDCAGSAHRAEAMLGIPDNLLAAIAQVESGRQRDGAGRRIPWPWTINADGRPFFYETKAQAIEGARSLKAAGARNLDVGCMQISLLHHPKAFGSLEQAFDPQANIAYGAQFLVTLQRESGAWATAVGHYHSRTPALSAEYRDRVAGVLTVLSKGMAVTGLSARATALPPYPDRRFDNRPPIDAFEYYRERRKDDPTDRQAALGWAIAVERLARLREMPLAEARLAYARVLMVARDDRVVLGRLFELIGDESPERQVELLEQAFILAGGPADLAAKLAECSAAIGLRQKARHYLSQAGVLGLSPARLRELERRIAL